MRYDSETAAAQMVADYLLAVLDPSTVAASPVVTFYDPMSIDEANRIVVMVPSVDTDPACPGNLSVTLECVVKSQWAQPTISTDRDSHFEKVNDVRDKLMAADMPTRLAAYEPAGLGVSYVQPRRQFSTRIMEGWYVSESGLRIQCFVKQET
jgi:hypothetical protein